MLLATDLDGTFLAGNPEDRLSLYQTIAAHPEIKLAYVTGRSLEAVLPLLADPTLPQPDYIIADVGATLVHGDSLQPIQQLQSLVDTRWPGETQVAGAVEPFGLERQDVPQARRCSYFCTPEQAANPQLRQIADELGLRPALLRRAVPGFPAQGREQRQQPASPGRLAGAEPRSGAGRWRYAQ
jgi:hypothetical protein